ncbi:MAG: type II/IV secretion system ATPase subunit [Candidatus Nanoarchaeia archaeon]
MVEELKYELEREGTERNLVIHWQDIMSYPNVEYNPAAMEKVIDIIIESGPMTSITFETQKNYVYPFSQTRMLNEIARVFIYLVKERRVLVSDALMSEKGQSCVQGGYVNIKELVNIVKSDPVGAYVKAVRLLRQARAEIKNQPNDDCNKYRVEYESILSEVVNQLKTTEMVKQVEDLLPGHTIGDREIYAKMFEPIIKPNFMYTRLVSEPPQRGEQVDSYDVGNSNVSIYSMPDKVRLLYHIITPEYKLDESEYSLLNDARQIMAKFKPKKEEFINPERMREVFLNISKDLVEELAQQKKIKISYKKMRLLANILMRLTVGFGLVEELLSDDKVEDVYVNAPVGASPIIIKHAIHGECETNIYPNITESRAWSSRFRMLSGRSLDEANPVLDTELTTPEIRSRVAIIQDPLSPKGLSFTFRRHRPKPWTLPLFMKAKMINPLAAGLYSFLIDGSRTMLVAGTRGSGKTSLLSSLLIEIMRRFRVITVEDTLEIPVDYMRNLGYNILSMKVRSAIVGSKSELSAADGIRTSLRLGDSCLIVGEVRSTEALSLYEAMRVGALANVVAGTIHGDTPYGIFDRLVNDLGVPRTSFKATDIITIASKLREPSGLREVRRVTDITEVRKDWDEDPLREHAFVSLMRYDTDKGELVPTPELLEGESEVIKNIAGKVKAWSGKWDLVWDNILLRTKIKELMLEYGEKSNNSLMLESDFIVQANDQFHKIFDDLTNETGYPDSNDVIREFEHWIKIKAREMASKR